MRKTASWKAAVAAVVVLFSWERAAAQGIPVIDISAIAQAIQQLQQMQAQMEQLKQTHGSFNKLTNMGDVAAILNRPEVRRTLPKDFSSIDKMLKGDGAGSYNDDVYVNPSSPANDAYVASVQRQRGINAGERNVASQMYDAAGKKIEGLETLRQQIGSAEDPKTVMDLQARALIEIASSMAVMQQMMAVQFAAGADQKSEDLRRAQEWEQQVERLSTRR